MEGVHIWHDDRITLKFSDRRYNLGVKGHGQIYLKSVEWLITLTLFIFYEGVCPFFGTIIVYGVQMTTKVQDCQYDIAVKGKGKKYLNLGDGL